MTKRIVFKEVLLVLTTIIWGLGFIAQSIGGEYLDAFSFNLFRNIVATIFLLGFIFIQRIIKKKKNVEISKTDKKTFVKAGLFIGLALALAMTFQQLGINSEGAGKSGFLTSLYIVFVPLIGIIFGKRINKLALIAIVFSLTGLYLINVNNEGFSFNLGTLYLLLCAIFYSFQIIFIDKYSKQMDSTLLSMEQFLFSIIFLLPLSFIFGSFSIDGLVKAIPAILYLGIVSSGIAYTLQVYAQSEVNVTIACIIMSLESVFSLVFGMIFLDEKHTFIQILGCVSILLAVILSQLNPKKKVDGGINNENKK